MSWDKAKEESEKADDSIFIKLKDGQAVSGVFAGDPYIFYSIFKDPKEYQEKVKGSSLKFKVNFVIKNQDGSFALKIFQQGNTFLKDLLEMREEYGLDYVYKIKRKGTGKDDTKYHILPVKPLDDGQKQDISNLDLLDLVKKDKPADETPPPAEDGDPGQVDEDGMPF